MGRLQQWLKLAGAATGLRVVTPFEVVLPSGAPVRAEALIVGIGSKKGMLVVTSFDRIREHSDELVKEGYGFSTLDEPRAEEVLDVEAMKEMFRDWGWDDSAGSGV